MKKILISYAYHQTENTKINLDLFMKKGYYKNNNIIYNIIVSSKNKIEFNFPIYNNINIIYFENEGSGWPSWKYSLDNSNIKNFDYFFFLKDYLNGPYYQGNWIKYVTEKINDMDKLIGLFINYKVNDINHPYLNSGFLCTDKIGIQIFYKTSILSIVKNDIKTYRETILSLNFLKKNYNLVSLTNYSNINWLKDKNLVNIVNRNNLFKIIR